MILTADNGTLRVRRPRRQRFRTGNRFAVGAETYDGSRDAVVLGGEATQDYGGREPKAHVRGGMERGERRREQEAVAFAGTMAAKTTSREPVALRLHLEGGSHTETKTRKSEDKH